jgi:hypothetical protein
MVMTMMRLSAKLLNFEASSSEEEQYPKRDVCQLSREIANLKLQIKTNNFFRKHFFWNHDFPTLSKKVVESLFVAAKKIANHKKCFLTKDKKGRKVSQSNKKN